MYGKTGNKTTLPPTTEWVCDEPRTSARDRKANSQQASGKKSTPTLNHNFDERRLISSLALALHDAMRSELCCEQYCVQHEYDVAGHNTLGTLPVPLLGASGFPQQKHCK